MFAQLDTKTVYSFMDSVIDIENYIQKACELGYKTLGIMDRDNLYTAYHFVKACEKVDIQPIIGLEIKIAIKGQSVSLQLISLNTNGYKQLMKISTAVMTNHRDWDDIVQFLEDIAIIIPYKDNKEVVKEVKLPMSYYIGVYPDTEIQSFSAKTIALHQVRYFEKEDIETLHVLHAIRENTSLSNTPPPTPHQEFLSPFQIEAIFQERYPEALDNLDELVKGVKYTFDSHLKLPRFNPSKEAVVELRELAEAGLLAKGCQTSFYQKRLDHELSIIHKMGFDDYFLIVWDLIQFGLRSGYYMGMGRGSAAGSLVAYALDITGIDPVKNNLLFERFLNEERYSMPDIDIDLPDIYRTHFLNYTKERYGDNHSAQIVTFSTFGAKQAIRDVFKRFGAKEYELSNLTKKIGFKDTLDSAYQKQLSLRQLINSRVEFQKAFAIAKRIEGKPRQTSIHAAGVVMSDDLLTEHIPLKSGEDMMITQYDASAVEANGLLKMDFLGLRNLTFVQKMKEKLFFEQGISIDIREIDLEDQKTLELFARGDTKGIFQFEQAGAINLLKRIKPQRFEEVVATTSLNRPGASDYIENFINRKYGKEQVDLIDPLIAPILEPTYGIMLYQEQVMQIAQLFGGFTLGKADLLRRAMSKKDAREMQRMESDFLVGAQSLGHSLTTAKHLFAMMAKFAGYGFNKSHAYAYSALAFQLAYFKAHYPSIFYDVMLNYSSSDYITDALSSHFKLAKPNINNVGYHDKINQNYILLGMKHIRQLPKDLAFWIIENRPFVSIEDFLTRLPEKYHKQTLLAPLIQIGLFDEFDTNRRQILENLDTLFIFVTELGSLFADSSYSWTIHDDYSDLEKYQLEQDILGVGISPHPLIGYLKDFKGHYTPFDELIPDQRATLLCQISSIRIIRTKSTGQEMAFLKVSDSRKHIDVTLFPEVFSRYKSLIQEDQMVWVKGKVKKRDDQMQLVLEELELLKEEKLWILLANHEHDQIIADILSRYNGDIPVVLRYQETRETLRIQEFRVRDSTALLNDLSPYVLKTIFQ
ncbi:DNA polymerase III subunit alpha [Streptococcus fryi]